MRLSPLELRKHQFAKKFRLSGYDADEVNGFIRQMADQWAEVLEDNRRLEDRAKELEGKLTHYEKVELALQEALETARHTARQVEDNAEKKANLTIESAELRAQQMLQDAEQERYSIKQDLVKLNSRQSEIAARMRAFLMAEMEVLAQFQGDDPFGFIRLVSANDPGSSGMLAEGVSKLASSDSDLPSTDGINALADEPVEEEQADASDEVVPDIDEMNVVEEPSADIEEPVSAMETEPVEEVAKDAEPILEEVVDESSEEAMPYPPAAVPPPPPPLSARPPVIPPPILERPPLPPPPAPVEEPVVLAPTSEPTKLPSVEELIAQTPPPPPPKPTMENDEVEPQPTYRDMLSGSQPSSEEATESPFSSSFFKSPFSAEEKSIESDVHSEPVSDEGSGSSWSLRSLVSGDGDSEPTTSSPSEAERERIRRILEDLD